MTLSSSSALRAPEYQIQVIGLCHSEAVKLPTFCVEDLIWLLQPTLKGEAGLPLLGISLSVQNDAQPDVLTLSHKSRLLLLQIPQDEEEIDGVHSGLDLLKDLLLCSSNEGDDDNLDPLRNTDHAGVGIQLASTNGSEIAYLLYHALKVHSCMLDLDLLASPMGYRKVPPFNWLQVIKTALGQKSTTLLSLAPHQFRVLKGNATLETAFLVGLITCIRMAIGCYEVASLFTQSCQKNHGEGWKILQAGKIDTRVVPANLIHYIARFERVELALKLNKSKVSFARLRTNNTSKESGIQFKLSKKGDSFEVTNEQYKSRLAKSTQQLLEISLTDKDGQSHTYSAKTKSSSGKTSTLNFVGKDEKVALGKLRAGALVKMGDAGGIQVDSVEVRGRDDFTPAEIDGMKWRRQIMCRNESGDGHGGESRLLSSFLLGESGPSSSSVEGVIDKKTVKLMERSEGHKYSIITAKEAKGKLNASQAKAARAIMSPLSVKGEEKGKQLERLIIIHGPPGTGKTSLITACCEQWKYSCANVEGGDDERARDAIYACCQSNVAVKNIAESFSRAKINFKIIVSPNFYVEWHEDLYADIQFRLIRTDQLPTVINKLHEALEDCDVVLSTLAFLSSPKVVSGDCPLFRLRRMRILFIDEASQIHLRAYPHLLQRFGKDVARFIFLGDDRQLPPFQGDEVIDAGLSVFELSHLRKKAFLLDTCYRLAKPMAQFISDNVYDGQLQVGPSNYDPKDGLLGCASFIDVTTSSVETKQGTSRMNKGEVDMVVKLVEEYKKRGGSLSNLKVLTTYDAQRDSLEEALQKVKLSGSSDLVFSVDSFQGRESDYIILSLVKDGKPTIRENNHIKGSKLNKESNIVKYLQPGLGFLSNDRRINVALTRARKGIVVISNRKFIIETAAETLVGKLQVELQWNSEGGESHWWDEDDVLNNRLPLALFASLPKEPIKVV